MFIFVSNMIKNFITIFLEYLKLISYMVFGPYLRDHGFWPYYDIEGNTGSANAVLY